MMRDSVSIILPIYNAGPYLRLAVESIVSQTHTNIEILIIDDGSSDNTLSLLTKYFSHLDQVKVFSRENRGLVRTLNELIEIASGDFIARMDADDISDLSRIERQLNFLKSESLDLCGTFYKKIDESGNVLDPVQLPQTHREVILALARRSPFAHGSVMASADIFKKFSYAEGEYSSIEDYSLWTQMAINGVRMGNLPEYLFYYREHMASFSRQKLKTMKSKARKLGMSYLVENNFEINEVLSNLDLTKANAADYFLSINLSDMSRLAPFEFPLEYIQSLREKVLRKIIYWHDEI